MIRSLTMPAAVLFLLMQILSAASARGSKENSDLPVPTGPVFAIVYPIVHPFFNSVTEMAVRYGAERNIRVIARAPESMDVDQQIRIMEELMTMKVDGIALCATDPEALAPSADMAAAGGIPLITFESDMPDSGRICFLGTDNYLAGVHLAEVVGRELGGRGGILLCTGLPAQLSLNQRIQGIEDTLAEKYPEVTILSIRSGRGDPAATLDVIEEQIKAFPDFDVFTSIDATGGPLAVAIWKARGWKGDRHKIITFDDMPENLEGIRSGIVTSVISQKQWTWGRLIIDRLSDIRNGAAVPVMLDTGTVEISKRNIDSYKN